MGPQVSFPSCLSVPPPQCVWGQDTSKDVFPKSQTPQILNMSRVAQVPLHPKPYTLTDAPWKYVGRSIQMQQLTCFEVQHLSQVFPSGNCQLVTVQQKTPIKPEYFTKLSKIKE